VKRQLSTILISDSLLRHRRWHVPAPHWRHLSGSETKASTASLQCGRCLVSVNASGGRADSLASTDNGDSQRPALTPSGAGSLKCQSSSPWSSSGHSCSMAHDHLELLPVIKFNELRRFAQVPPRHQQSKMALIPQSTTRPFVGTNGRSLIDGNLNRHDPPHCILSWFW
jgi:hypothetical protein